MLYKFKEAVDIISGGTPKTSVPEYWNGDIGWLSVVDFGDKNKYVETTEKTITQAGVDNSSTKVLQINDIIISARGTVGAMAMLKKPLAFNQSCFGLRGKTEIINQEYLFYYLKNYMKVLKAKTQGSVFDTINLATFDLIDLNLPTLDKQERIAHILATIDNKIDANQAINAELESMAKTIYDYWFLQFEFPNEEGKPYKSSGGKMVWNAELKREIPEGWEAKQIKDIATTNRGISYTAKDLADIGTPILSLASVSRTGAYIPEGIKYFCGEVPSSKELKPYDLIMCNTDMTQQREVIARCIMVPDIFENVITHTHHITKVSLNDDSYNSYFCSTTQSSWFHEYVKGFSSGTNVLGLDAKAFDKIWLPVPDKNAAEKYNKTFMKLQKDKSNLLKQNQELASLRDFLLPMLMNGQITFKDN